MCGAVLLLLRQEKKHKSLNNPSLNQVREVRRVRRMVAALPETSPGARTSFTYTYTTRRFDHLEIYAFFVTRLHYCNLLVNCDPFPGNA